jgi:hypothetical protein
MLDLLGIVFSSSIMFLVVLRAIQLDAQQPWFRPPRTGTDSSGLKLRPSRSVRDQPAVAHDTARGLPIRDDTTRGG